MIEVEGWGDLPANRASLLDFQHRTQVNLFLERVVNDHDQVAPGLRKALIFKEALKIHQAAGCFLFFMQKLQQLCPEKDFLERQRGLRSQFMSGFLDADLISTLEEQVPAAADIKSVKAFRPVRWPGNDNGFVFAFSACVNNFFPEASSHGNREGPDR